MREDLEAAAAGNSVLVLDEFEMLHNQLILGPVLHFINSNPTITFILVSNCPSKLKE